MIGGVAWWLVESAGPAWAVYPTVSAAVFFAERQRFRRHARLTIAGTVGLLLFALVVVTGAMYLPEFGRLINRLSI